MKNVIKNSVFWLVVVLSAVMFASCEKLSELEIKFIDANNNPILDGGVISVVKDTCTTLKLQVIGKKTKQSIKVLMTILYEKGGVYESEQEIATLFKNTNSTDVTFCDKVIGNYRAKITLEPEGCSKTNPSKVCTFHIRIIDNGENPPDPKGFKCYVDNILYESNSTITITTNSQMKVKHNASVPNGTKVHYKWDTGNYSSVEFTSNEARIDLPHLQGTTRTLKVKVDDCPEQTFTIKSEGCPPPGGFNCYINGSLAGSIIEIENNVQMIVQTIHQAANGTPVYYKWDNGGTHQVGISANKAEIPLPYVSGTTKTLKIWMDGYPEQTFTIKSKVSPQGGFECYVNGTLYHDNSIIEIPQTTSLIVKTLHAVPNNTLVYYKWSDETNYRTAVLLSNQTSLELPHTPGTTRTLKIWMNGYPEQTFTIKSEATPPGGFNCYVDGSLANSTIHLYASTQNTYMTVKTIHSVSNYTLVYYKWNDETSYKTASFYSNEALIVLTYTPGTTRILDVWMNGYEKQVFLVQSH